MRRQQKVAGSHVKPGSVPRIDYHDLFCDLTTIPLGVSLLKRSSDLTRKPRTSRAFQTRFPGSSAPLFDLASHKVWLFSL